MGSVTTRKTRGLVVGTVAFGLLSIAVWSITASAQEKAGRLRHDQGRLAAGKSDGLFAALQEPVPPVEIHHVLFGRPVQLATAEARDETGAPTQEPVNLRFASSGLVVGQDGRAFRVDVGDVVSVGDFIVGGVIENSGTAPVLVLFAEGGGPELRPGERLYIGSSERLVRDGDFDGAVIANHQIGPGTHCAVCSCTCSCSGGGNCNFTFDTNNSGGDQCGASNGSGCVCSGENGCSGSASGCNRIYLPCEPVKA